MLETGQQMFWDWVTDLQEYPPHAWLNDPREPLFTFMWNGTEFGFYAMSLTYWIEICLVSIPFSDNPFLQLAGDDFSHATLFFRY
jgi:hypothetical protein